MSQYLDKDGASRIAENFLSKQAEQDAILRNLQFDLKEAEHALVKTIQGPAPLNIRALTRPLDDYAISGNTTQNGTPTPSDPVDVVGCGVRTENLFDYETMSGGKTNYYLDASGNELENIGYWSITKYIPVDGTVFTLARTFIGNAPAICLYDSNKNFITGVSYQGEQVVTISSNTNAAYIRFSYFIGEPLEDIAHDMLNTGSTAKPYEPYGYKLPITVNGTEYPIYLGQVPTTRRIKKLVIDGTESAWQDWNGLNLFRVPDTSLDYRAQKDGAICDRLPLVMRGDLTTNTFCWSSGTIGEFIININNYNLADLKTYLSSNPITVYYVLATPETGIVNEPLMKIGDYADTISMAQTGVTLTTKKGFNTITTDTTVLPSNIEAKGVINNA